MSLVFVISYCFLINGVLFILFSWEILFVPICVFDFSGQWVFVFFYVLTSLTLLSFNSVYYLSLSVWM